MEHYAHSISKKSYGGNVFGSGSHNKSVYDDVFGGQTKFGGQTIAPRFEDYGEIFSGFHSSRGLSIPILDLPRVDEEEISFDIRSAWFDYSEVFGGFHDLDFAVSFDDLVRRFESVDYSSDDAWSPIQSGSLSGELDPSVSSTNADSSYIATDFTEFNTTYYMSNQRTSREIAINLTEEPQLNDISGHDSYIFKNHVPQEQIEPPETVDSFDSEKKFKPFVTINDISLRTKPSRIPPPSRPPPLIAAIEKGTFGKANLSPNDSNKCSFERGEGSHSPPFYDVEVDVNNTTYCQANTRGTHATEGIIGINENVGNKLPHKFRGNFAWRQETEYIEVIETDLPSVSVVLDKDESLNHHIVEASNQETRISADRVKDCQNNSSSDNDYYEDMIGVRKIGTRKQTHLQDESYESVENAVKAQTQDSENGARVNVWGTNGDEIVMNIQEKKHIEMDPAEDYQEKHTQVADVSLSAITIEECNENTITLAFDKNYSENNAPNGDAFNNEALSGNTILKELNSEVSDSINEEIHVAISPQKLDNTRFRNLETTPTCVSHAKDEILETNFQTNDQKLEEKAYNIVVEEDTDMLKTSTEASCSDQPVTDSKPIGIGSSSTEIDIKSAPITHDHRLNVRSDSNSEHEGKITSGVRLSINQDQRSNNADREERCANELIASEKRMKELRLQKQREFEKEKLSKLEEEREREREREKDRMAIDDSIIYGRQRTVSTRERLQKETMEVVHERYLSEKASSMEVAARLRAERAAVEKATAEARQRAFAKTMNEKPSVSQRVERTVSDKFSSSSRIADARQFYETHKVPPQGAGSSSMLRYSYSSLNSGIESESPQRYKARLERYRRTAERAANALAEKNTRDLIAQKELTERSRLAEHLDVEVKRWSSGKEGNLRALLSTLQYIVGPDSGWQPIPLTEVITTAAVKKAYRKATLCVHPDKVQQRGATIQHKYICEKVFDLLQEAWKTFTSEER